VNLQPSSPAGRARHLLLAVSVAVVLASAACSSDPDAEDSTSTSTPATQVPATATSGKTAPTAADEAAVRRLLDQINTAWAQGDATAYASHHTPDADLVDFRGTHVVGRTGIIGLLQPAFDGPLKNTRVEARIVDLRFLTPDVAIFHTEGKIAPVGEDSVQTFIATKDTDRWLIAAFQNTRKQPPPGR
jgi:uncharacterized protein (TIGR02246 family)